MYVKRTLKGANIRITYTENLRKTCIWSDFKHELRYFTPNQGKSSERSALWFDYQEKTRKLGKSKCPRVK